MSTSTSTKKVINVAFVNATDRTITMQTVTAGNFLKECYALIGNDCTVMDLVRHDTLGDVWVDEEGLLKPNVFFALRYGDQLVPYAGNAVLSGHNYHGDTVDTSVTIEQLTNEVVFGELLRFNGELLFRDTDTGQVHRMEHLQ